MSDEAATPKEQWYDDEVAPLLKAIGDKCAAKNVSMVAVVEYDPGERGETSFLADPPGLAMIMLKHLAKCGTNVDGFIIGLKRYCREHDVDVSRSIYLGDFPKVGS